MIKILLIILIFFTTPSTVYAGGCNAVFTVEAWEMLENIVFALKILVPIILILLTSSDFAKIVISGEKNTSSEQAQKVIIRIISAILFFLVPTIVMAILNLAPIKEGLNLVDDPTCGIFDGEVNR